MIDIYDEVGYIKNVLEGGFSSKWERDAILLVRYYKIEGYKKSAVKKIIRQKCEEGNNKGMFVYNHLVSYKRLNKIIDAAWKKKDSLRAIKYVEISKEVLQWFLDLEKNYIITDEEQAYLKERRPNVSIKNNRPINWQRTKYLFTLYIWTKIQENYNECPYMIKLKPYNKRFKEDANLKQSFSMINERNLLCDLGLIKLTYKLSTEVSFIKNFDVFKIPITDENRVIIETGEPPEGELYNPGYWLEKQKMGSFICQNCGKEFAHYSNTKQEKCRKYCRECGDLIRNSHLTESVEKKIIICVDCGTEVEVSKFDSKTCRCEDCQGEYIREYDRKRKAKVNDKG